MYLYVRFHIRMQKKNGDSSTFIYISSKFHWKLWFFETPTHGEPLKLPKGSHFLAPKQMLQPLHVCFYMFLPHPNQNSPIKFLYTFFSLKKKVSSKVSQVDVSFAQSLGDFRPFAKLFWRWWPWTIFSTFASKVGRFAQVTFFFTKKNVVFWSKKRFFLQKNVGASIFRFHEMFLWGYLVRPSFGLVWFFSITHHLFGVLPNETDKGQRSSGVDTHHRVCV